MHRNARLPLALALIAAGALTVGTGASAQPEPQPVTLPCATNVSAQVLGNTLPSNAEGQALVLARIVFGPGGSIGAHTHPGTLIVSVESGTLGFTLVDDHPMAVMRAAGAGTPAAEEPLTTGTEIELAPGDYFVETGMVHTARSLGDEPASVLVSGLIEAGRPLTECVEGTPTP